MRKVLFVFMAVAAAYVMPIHTHATQTDPQQMTSEERLQEINTLNHKVSEQIREVNQFLEANIETHRKSVQMMNQVQQLIQSGVDVTDFMYKITDLMLSSELRLAHGRDAVIETLKRVQALYKAEGDEENVNKTSQLIMEFLNVKTNEAVLKFQLDDLEKMKAKAKAKSKK